MGLLVRGQWVDRWYDTEATGGEFLREDAQFRSWITPDGAAGPSGEGGFRAESGRYRLYVSHACPWAHRTLIYRHVKGLDAHIPVSVVHWHMGEDGWTFAPGPGVIPDPELGAGFMHEIYTAARADYTGRVTVPVLWDRERRTIVNNESAEIIRMMDSAFEAIAPGRPRLAPEASIDAIDAINARVYDAVNNGVYKCGFASRQDVYERHVRGLFEALDELESRLGGQRYLLGATITEPDWRLFTTLLRFDSVYVGHFKCSLRRIVDYPNLWGYLRDLYQQPGITETVHMDHIKNHYYG
ncbi:MAG: glutathione S-transferase family protein, partial [Myxococcales bacterium]|nr:glutathione S-transferase family protein [Myxococcales bacterium]